LASHDDIKRIALSLPETVEEEGAFRFGVRNPAKPKFSFHTQSFVWALYDRPNPRKPRVIRPDVIAVRLADLDEKAALLDADPGKYFREPHYDGCAVIGVMLSEIEIEELTELITDAWRSLASASAMGNAAY
jgi:hypothetical protein